MEAAVFSTAITSGEFVCERERVRPVMKIFPMLPKGFGDIKRHI
jgi:hypothetical protein